MRRLAFLAALAAAAALSGAHACAAGAAKAKTMEGRIAKFECGDNCYLTIKTANGHEETGLCVARDCAPWNDKTEMPKRYVGKRVRATLGVGTQVDGGGNVQGRMTSFEAIEFLP